MTMKQYHAAAPSHTVAPSASVPAIPPAALEALSKALVSERKLIDDLISVVLTQRSAVGVDDVQGVDDSVFATHRLLLTLGEARKRRRSINEMLGCSEDTGVRQLDAALGPWMTPKLRTERDGLQDSARILSREIEINRRILREALANSESFVRAMRGAPPDSTQSGYGSTAPTAYTRSDATAFSRTA
ncbi:MAG: flagellar protein FlgN [Gemmatimonadaceae bacterium]